MKHRPKTGQSQCHKAPPATVQLGRMEIPITEVEEPALDTQSDAGQQVQAQLEEAKEQLRLVKAELAESRNNGRDFEVELAKAERLTLQAQKENRRLEAQLSQALQRSHLGTEGRKPEKPLPPTGRQPEQAQQVTRQLEAEFELGQARQAYRQLELRLNEAQRDFEQIRQAERNLQEELAQAQCLSQEAQQARDRLQEELEQALQDFQEAQQTCCQLEVQRDQAQRNFESAREAHAELRSLLEQAIAHCEEAHQANSQLTQQLTQAQEALKNASEKSSEKSPQPIQATPVLKPARDAVPGRREGYLNLLKKKLFAGALEIELLSFRPEDRSISFSSKSGVAAGEHSVIAHFGAEQLRSRIRVESDEAGIYYGCFLGPVEAIPHLKALLPSSELRARVPRAPRSERVLRVMSSSFPGYQAVTLDLSVTGMRLKLDSPLPEGLTFDCQVELDDESPGRLPMQCQVAWCRLDVGQFYLIGVVIVKLSKEARARLQHFLESLGHIERTGLTSYYMRS